MQLLCSVFQYLLKSYQPFKAYSNAFLSLDAFPNPFQRERYFLPLNTERTQWLLIHMVPLSLSCVLVSWAQILFSLLAETFLKSRDQPVLHVTCQKNYTKVKIRGFWERQSEQLGKSSLQKAVINWKRLLKTTISGLQEYTIFRSIIQEKLLNLR